MLCILNKITIKAVNGGGVTVVGQSQRHRKSDREIHTEREIHAYIISYALGWKCHSQMKHMFFILQSHRVRCEAHSAHLSPVWLCNTSTPICQLYAYIRATYANAFQIDICVRIIIFNGCRVSRLTVLFVLLISVGTNFIVTFHTCDSYIHTRRVRERRTTGTGIGIATHTQTYKHRICNENVQRYTFNFYTHRETQTHRLTQTHKHPQFSGLNQPRKKTT